MVRLATAAVVLSGDDGLKIIGSAVSVGTRGLLLTAKHVLEDIEQAARELREEGKRVAMSFLFPTRFVSATREGDLTNLEMGFVGAQPLVLVRNPDFDLAVARLDPSASMASLRISSRPTLREGMRVATCGYPFGLEVHEGKSVLSSFLDGMVSAVVPHPDLGKEFILHYLLQLPVNPGNSGGPVFDPETGELLAIVSRVWTTGGTQTALCIAEPIHRFENLITDCLEVPVGSESEEEAHD